MKVNGEECTLDRAYDLLVADAPIKIGDLVYAVGPGHNPPHSADDLQLYSTPVTAVRLDGSYSDTCPPEILNSARRVIELGNDRPYLSFSKGTYYDLEFGYNLHRSRAEALQAYAPQASHRRDQAEREWNIANKQVQWALAQVATTAEDVPLSSSNHPTAAAVAATDTENAP